MDERLVKLIVECDVGIETEAVITELCRVKYSLPALDCYVVEVKQEDYPKVARLRGIRAVHDTARITAQMDVARVLINAGTTRAASGRVLTGKGIGIAILDTGVGYVRDLTDPDDRIVAFKDFIGDKTKPYDDNAHGTHVWY